MQIILTCFLFLLSCSIAHNGMNDCNSNDVYTIVHSNGVTSLCLTNFDESLGNVDLTQAMPHSYLADENFVTAKELRHFPKGFLQCPNTNCYYLTKLTKDSCKQCQKIRTTIHSLQSSPRRLSIIGDTDSKHLQKDVEASHEVLVSVLLAVYIIGSLILCYVGDIPTVFIQLLLSQCQSIMVISWFNMNIPNKYVKFSKSFDLASFTFDFLDFITLKDELQEEFGDRTGRISLNNVGYETGSLFVEYIYFFVVLAILIALNITLSLIAW